MYLQLPYSLHRFNLGGKIEYLTFSTLVNPLLMLSM